MRDMYGQALKEARHLNSNVSTVIHGLTGMNGDIVYLNHGTHL
jgi:hypothetical protein